MYANNDRRSDVFKEVGGFMEFVKLLSLGSPASSRYESRRGIRDSNEYCIVQRNSVFEL
jgi:hypothetical protein